jgi:hypothetical protein
MVLKMNYPSEEAELTALAVDRKKRDLALQLNQKYLEIDARGAKDCMLEAMALVAKGEDLTQSECLVRMVTVLVERGDLALWQKYKREDWQNTVFATHKFRTTHWSIGVAKSMLLSEEREKVRKESERLDEECAKSYPE